MIRTSVYNRTGLGLVPNWQFSEDPTVNIKINPHVKIPSDWPQGQRTVQPIGWNAWRSDGDPAGDGLTPETGLGLPRARWKPARADLAGLSDVGPFAGWAWTNRKWLVIGGAGLLGLGVLAGLGAVLR